MRNDCGMTGQSADASLHLQAGTNSRRSRFSESAKVREEADSQACLMFPLSFRCDSSPSFLCFFLVFFYSATTANKQKKKKKKKTQLPSSHSMRKIKAFRFLLPTTRGIKLNAADHWDHSSCGVREPMRSVREKVRCWVELISPDPGSCTIIPVWFRQKKKTSKPTRTEKDLAGF